MDARAFPLDFSEAIEGGDFKVPFVPSLRFFHEFCYSLLENLYFCATAVPKKIFVRVMSRSEKEGMDRLRFCFDEKRPFPNSLS